MSELPDTPQPEQPADRAPMDARTTIGTEHARAAAHGRTHERATPNRFLVHKPLVYGKKFYFSEFLAERLIQTIAILSIGVILAIFYYVFQEASYAFRDPRHASTSIADPSAPSTSKEGPLVAESYGGEETPTAPGQGAGDPLQPETYGLETEAAPGAPGSPATPSEGNSLESGRNASQSAESGGGENAVTVGQLILPNDLIDNEPRHIWQPIGSVPKYSFVPLFMGALKVTIIGLLIAGPIAILAALFTTSFAPRWIREIMKPAIEILAGFPSVVIGFFCLITIATLLQSITGSEYRLNSFVGGIGMALAVIPIVFTVTEDALSAVPRSMKEASIALGASRWQTAWRVVLPAATPGVFAALILGFGRAFGETMIALMATGNAALTSIDLFESVRTMSATIGAEMAEVEFHGVHYGVLFLIGAVLFVVTFTLNALAEFYVRKRLIKKFQGN